jgi:hypothetical protein
MEKRDKDVEAAFKVFADANHTSSGDYTYSLRVRYFLLFVSDHELSLVQPLLSTLERFAML